MVDVGVVVWITGLAGAGKSTLARHLATTLRNKGTAVVVLDGDEMRAAFGVAGAYRRADRLALAMSYARLAELVARSGVVVVVATISLFHDVHAWNRAHLRSYVEVYLQADRGVLEKRRALYKSAGDVVGIDVAPEIPIAPHVVIEVAGDIELDDAVTRIVAQLETA